MLNFNVIFKPVEVVVPIYENKFIYNKKLYKLRSEDGWFRVELYNNIAKIIEQHYTQDDINKAKLIGGYTYNNSVIFSQFDVSKRKFNLEMQAPLLFNKIDSFNAIYACIWEDNKAYYVEPNYSDFNIETVKSQYEQELSLEGIKNITPELRTLYLFHSIERENTKKLLELQIKVEEEKRLLETIPGRLKVSFERGGARLLGYSLSGSRIIVDWCLPDSGYKYNSVIDSNTWKIIECGYCCSNDDVRHNITSMIKLAESYEADGLTYITRR